MDCNGKKDRKGEEEERRRIKIRMEELGIARTRVRERAAFSENTYMELVTENIKKRSR